LEKEGYVKENSLRECCFLFCNFLRCFASWICARRRIHDANEKEWNWPSTKCVQKTNEPLGK